MFVVEFVLCHVNQGWDHSTTKPLEGSTKMRAWDWGWLEEFLPPLGVRVFHDPPKNTLRDQLTGRWGRKIHHLSRCISYWENGGFSLCQVSLLEGSYFSTKKNDKPFFWGGTVYFLWFVIRKRTTNTSWEPPLDLHFFVGWILFLGKHLFDRQTCPKQGGSGCPPIMLGNIFSPSRLRG